MGCGSENYKPDSEYRDRWWNQPAFFGLDRSEFVLVVVVFVVGGFAIWYFPGVDTILGIHPR